jgi:hypothetical protein
MTASLFARRCAFERRSRFYPSRPVRATFFSAALALAIVLLHATPALSVTNQWLGSGGPNWETPGSWSLGHVPLASEDVLFPAGSPSVTVDGSEKVIRSLRFNDEVFLLGYKIHTQPGAGVRFAAAQDVYLGNFCGATSAANIVIRAGGNLTIRHLLTAGAGASGNKGTSGGSIELTGVNVLAAFALQAGNGGTSSGAGIASGSGGDIVIEASQSAGTGAMAAGNGGGGAIPGRPGLVIIHAHNQVTLNPTSTANAVAGGRLMVETDPGGTIIASGLVAQEIHMKTGVCLNTGSASGTIDLRSDEPSAIVSDAGRIQLYGSPMLDSGVTLADVTQPDGVVTSAPCDATVPAGSPGALAAAAALLLGTGLLAMRRARSTVHSAIGP